MGFPVFWDGKTKLFAIEGSIGVIVSVILLASAIAFPQDLQLISSSALEAGSAKDQTERNGCN
jgi:hypothetical protein